MYSSTSYLICLLKLLILFISSTNYNILLVTSESIQSYVDVNNLEYLYPYSIENISYITYYDNINENHINKEHKRSKQSIKNVIDLSNNYENSFKYEFGKTGALIIPKHKLVICTIAKAGCTQLKMMIIRLLGMNISEVCKNPIKVHTDYASPMYERYKGSYLLNELHPRVSVPCDPMQCMGEGIGVHVDTHRVELCHCESESESNPDSNTNSNSYADSNSMTVDPTLDSIPQMFLDDSWVTIAQVRDPWYRSISMYNDQIKRGFGGF